MKDKMLRKLFLGFIEIHILHHADKAPIYGVWMMKELEEHGYKISPGTIYPLLRKMEKQRLLIKEERIEKGKQLKYYTTTQLGKEILKEATLKAAELFHEISEMED